MIDKNYRIIYADPPWLYQDAQRNKKLGGAVKHYNTMTIEDICNLKVDGRLVKDLTEKNAILFLWVTSPKLNECWDVIRAWGFNYKTSFVWDKVKHNMGHYNSVRHEFLLICTKGQKNTPDLKKLIDSVQVFPKSKKHSEKPELFRNIIDLLYTKGNKLELFARRKVDGWDAWGNEID